MTETKESPKQERSPIITHMDTERFPLLEMVSQPCSLPISTDDEQAIAFMDSVLTQLDTEAAGLAAIQIGYPRRIFLLRNGINTNGEAENNVYINPVIIAKSQEQKLDNEACLSLPGMIVRCKRPKSVTIQYFDLNGKIQIETFKGFWSRCVMHEMSHLEGVLITSELEKIASKQVSKTNFGMKITTQNTKRIKDRRNKNKKAKASRKLNRAR